MFSLQFVLQSNKWRNTYPYDCCMNMQYIQIKEAIHMFILLTIAV